ncbi:MAG: hypothetical protein HY816_02255 [Candidatus Wallbacteria bacterium]|nr:hypothetical protein [Candidatus Wallbacteria bacterium]
MRIPRRFFLDGGMVLMYALSVLVILATIGLSLQSTGSSLMELAKESQYRRLAQHAADSGIRYGTAYVRELLDPVAQYNRDANGDITSPITIIDHTPTPPPDPGPLGTWDYQRSGNYPPVHPCNIYWRLNDPAQPVAAWAAGTADLTTRLATVALDPSQPIGASNPPMYATSFTLALRAINSRAEGMIGATTVPYGQQAPFGIRWQDLVDQAGAQFCHACTSTAPVAQDVSPTNGLLDSPPLVGPQASPITATCFTPWEVASPLTFQETQKLNAADTRSRGGLIVTSYCTYRYTQPYLLTCTGRSYIQNPANPGTFGQSAVATVAVSQIITVTTRLSASPGASTHSSYIVSAVNQEW